MFQPGGFLLNEYVYRYVSSSSVTCLYFILERIPCLQLFAYPSLPPWTVSHWGAEAVIPLCVPRTLTMSSKKQAFTIFLFNIHIQNAFSTSGLLTFGAREFFIIDGGLSLHGRIHNSAPDIYPLRTSPDFAKCPLGGKSILGWKPMTQNTHTRT